MNKDSNSLLTSPASEVEMKREAVREQLGRMLESPIFSKSKRYSNLLRYVVEATLEGDTNQLKERILGIEVFGRKSDYNTSLDPVVRIAASEIRRRIAQYYYQPGNENELRIDLPVGSYVPEFHYPANGSGAATVNAPVSETTSRKLKPVYIIAAALCLSAIVIAAMLKPWESRTALDLFWEPVVRSDSPVILCLGRRNSQPERQGQASTGVMTGSVGLRDATTLARVAGVLQAKGVAYTIRTQDNTTLADLRGGPAVLIGAFNNEWSSRLNSATRFRFHMYNGILSIEDQQNPSQLSWSVNRESEAWTTEQKKDYALISRAWNPTTEEVVVIAGGLTSYGTTAASEFLTSSNYLQEMANNITSNWASKNLQVVLETTILDGNSGPPRVVATHVW